RWLRQGEIDLETVKRVYRALQARLGRGCGPVAPEALQREVFGDGPDPFRMEADVRVAISLLEKSGLAARHPDLPRDISLRGLSRTGGDRGFREFAEAARLWPGEWQRLDALEWSRRSGLALQDLEPMLLEWSERGWLELRAGAREMLVE